MGSIVSANGEKISLVPSITEVVPFGSSILIEHLSAQELLGTELFVSDDTKVDGAPQAYILALGSKLTEDSGLKVGDRIVVQGTFVPMPRLANNDRVRGVIEVHNVKAILKESGR